jgi:hypothetical protein
MRNEERNVVSIRRLASGDRLRVIDVCAWPASVPQMTSIKMIDFALI